MQRVVEFELEIGSDAAVFEGHFPGNPVVPAALLLSDVAARLERHAGTGVTAAGKLRFSAPARPGVLQVRCEPLDRQRWRARVWQGEALVLRGLLTMAGEPR